MSATLYVAVRTLPTRNMKRRMVSVDVNFITKQLKDRRNNTGKRGSQAWSLDQTSAVRVGPFMQFLMWLSKLTLQACGGAQITRADDSRGCGFSRDKAETVRCADEDEWRLAERKRKMVRCRVTLSVMRGGVDPSLGHSAPNIILAVGSSEHGEQ